MLALKCVSQVCFPEVCLSQSHCSNLQVHSVIRTTHVNGLVGGRCENDVAATSGTHKVESVADKVATSRCVWERKEREQKRETGCEV